MSVEVLIKVAFETGATSLDLSNKSLTSVPNSITKLTKLTDLDLRNNQLTNLPESIGNLKQLSWLELSENQLTSLPKSIGSLTQLTFLDLGNNKITSLPESIGNLAQLTELTLYKNQLSNLPETIGNLTQLVWLHLDANQLSNLPEAIGNLTQLTFLDLGNNQIEILPESIGSLTQLTRLNLRGNQLSSLPETIEGLTRLTTLDLGKNQLTNLPQAIGELMQLNYLGLDSINLTLPPWQVIEKGFDSIRRWFKLKKQKGLMGNNESKVMLLGPPKVGKTSLRLKMEDINSKLPETPDRTVGVDLLNWTFPIEHNGSKYNAVARVFDFAGQKIQYMMHQFFLSSGAFHILVSNGKQSDSETDYWLSCIGALNDQARVLPLLNPYKSTKQPVLRESTNITFLPCLTVDLKLANEFILKGSIEQIKEYVSKYMRETCVPILTQWKIICRTLIDHKAHYIDIHDFRVICNENLLDEKDNQDDLLNYLHKLGYVLYFDHIQFDKVFLDPNWLVKALYTLFKEKNHLINGEGYFSCAALKMTWSKPDNDKGSERPAYTEQEQQILFNLLLRRRFNICYAVEDNPDCFLVPQSLPNTPRMYCWNHRPKKYSRVEQAHKEVKRKLCNYAMKLLPSGLMAQLIVMMQHLIAKDFNGSKAHWQNGMILTLNESRALVKLQKTTAYGPHLSVEIEGCPQGVAGLETRIKGAIEKLADTIYREYGISCYIPCEQCQELSEAGHKFQLEDSNEKCVYGHKRPIGVNQLGDGGGSVTNNYINISGIFQGVINNGSVAGDIREIESKLGILSSEPNKQELADALQAVLKAVGKDETLSDRDKISAVATIKELSSQAEQQNNERSGIVDIMLKGLEATMQISEKLKPVWDTWSPVILGFFA